MRAVRRKSNRRLDKIDLNILRILQQEGRLSYVDLANRVGLSTTPCLERVRRLEQEGIIEGYAARINPNALGLGLLVFVEISLSYQSTNVFDEFKKAICRIPYVMECHLVSGQSDYLVKARIPGMLAYRTLLGELLVTIPGITGSKSLIVMEEVKESFELTLDDNLGIG